MKFDGNLAWKQASTAVGGNRELLLALAGVFFFLPSFALIMLFKQPHAAPGATPEQVVAALAPFITAVAPWLIIGSVIQAFGQLTLIELFGHGGRPTVGEALRKSLAVLPSYVVVQLLTGFMMTSVLFLTFGLGSVVSPVLGLALASYLVSQAYARFITAGAIIVLERQMNPFAVLVRAVTLTRGNGFRIGNFLFLLMIAFFVGFIVLSILIGIATALTMGEGRAGDLVAGFCSSVITAAAGAYFAAIIVAIYRQLTAGARENASAPFD